MRFQNIRLRTVFDAGRLHIKARVLILAAVIPAALAAAAVIALYPANVDFAFKSYAFDCGKDYSREMSLAEEFVSQKLTSSDGGVYTNYLDIPSKGDITSGHAVLSESQGLKMLYCVKTGNREGFNLAWGFAKNWLFSKTGLYSWRAFNIGGKWQGDLSSAFLDDMRIARALATAWGKWCRAEYLKGVKKVSSSLLSHCVKDGLPVNFYDFKYGKSGSSTDLSYLDLYTMRLLSAIDRRWQGVYDKSLQVIRGGRLTDGAPLYSKTYTGGAYSTDDKINMIDSLIVQLHLSEEGLDNGEAQWLRQRLEAGPLYAFYLKDGSPAGDMQSTAVYALTAMIAVNVGDTIMYNEAVERMLKFQVKEAGSEIFGAFGNGTSLELYSYDNLTALLALSMSKAGE